MRVGEASRAISSASSSSAVRIRAIGWVASFEIRCNYSNNDGAAQGRAPRPEETRMGKHSIALALLALGFTQAVRADEAADLLARWKAASGGARWDAVKSVRTDGTLGAGGLSGAFDAVQDVAGGRSNDHYKLGPIEGADGYDGAVAWSRDPGGEVAALDAP